MTTLDYPIACRFDGADQAARLAEVETLFTLASSVSETERGYEFRFPGSDDMLERLARFVIDERRCCPFLAFTLHLPPGSESVALDLSGGEGVKEFIAETFVTTIGAS
jgi:hypothetical protein